MPKQKKILLLGGDNLLLPVIKAAHELGCYVITVDYLPDNADMPDLDLTVQIY
jgi:formate-dependent phosphoribosylglycinamide formyltransferase (GAR transformylase)